MYHIFYLICCISQSVLEKQNEQNLFIYLLIYLFIWDWLTCLWKLGSLKSIGKASKLETQAGVNAAVLR